MDEASHSPTLFFRAAIGPAWLISVISDRNLYYVQNELSCLTISNSLQTNTPWREVESWDGREWGSGHGDGNAAGGWGDGATARGKPSWT